MTDEPQLRLAEGQRLLDAGDVDAAVQILAPLTGHPDPELGGAAWLAIGTARYRLDDEAGALDAWRQAAARGGSTAWLGWRSVAEQEVRDGHLEEAVDAYREADRRAPPAERGAIANRIAWLLKETGHDFASRRQFNRARGAYASYQAYVTWTIVAINIVVFVVDGALAGGGFSLFGGTGPLADIGVIYGPAVAAGEWWRLITAAFLHQGILHIAFNMYLLWLFGPIIEQMYGHVEFAAIYLLCALGGNVLTILATPDQSALGASGAIFGLFGLAFVVSRRRHLILGPQARALLSRVGPLLVLNLVITFSFTSIISWTGHVGGLLVGGVIGLLLAPPNVPSMGGMWRAPDGSLLARRISPALRASAYLLVAAVLVLGTYVAIQQLG
jgi:membrane associated rhomboid family serine protease